jgi:hypothetical protein
MTYLFLWISPEGVPINHAFEASDLQAAVSQCQVSGAEWAIDGSNDLDLTQGSDYMAELELVHHFELRWTAEYTVWGFAQQMELFS